MGFGFRVWVFSVLGLGFRVLGIVAPFSGFEFLPLADFGIWGLALLERR